MLHVQSYIGRYWCLLVAISYKSGILLAKPTLQKVGIDERETLMLEAGQGWAAATIAGFRAMGASRYAEAAEYWLAAHRAAQSLDAQDPRRAAADTNAGLAHVLVGAQDEAEAALAAAERRWMRLLGLVETADVPLAAGSSSFQFRLASDNLEVFQDLQRKRLLRQCEAALAITRFNRLGAGLLPATDAMVAALAALLSECLGARAPEVRLLEAPQPSETDGADSPYADKAVELDARLGRLAAWPTDIWQLLGPAVALTGLLRPGLRAGSAAKPDVGSETSSARPAAISSSRR